jgi:hypothetical protein
MSPYTNPNPPSSPITQAAAMSNIAVRFLAEIVTLKFLLEFKGGCRYQSAIAGDNDCDSSDHASGTQSKAWWFQPN